MFAKQYQLSWIRCWQSFMIASVLLSFNAEIQISVAQPLKSFTPNLVTDLSEHVWQLPGCVAYKNEFYIHLLNTLQRNTKQIDQHMELSMTF